MPNLQSHDNLEEYRDAEQYDVENGGFEYGGPFYEQLASVAGGPILDLACGTGRITIPLAENGYDVTGVDITPEMIEAARRRAQHLAVRVEWILADCRNLQFTRTYGMAFMTGNAFQAFLTRQAQEEMLASVRRSLRPDGVFAFEARNPDLVQLADKSESEDEWGHFVDNQGREVRVSEQRWYDPVAQVEHYVTYRRWASPSGPVTRETRIDLRYVFPCELEALLHYNGFDLVERYGDFQRTPFQSDSRSMVCVCRPRT